MISVPKTFRATSWDVSDERKVYSVALPNDCIPHIEPCSQGVVSPRLIAFVLQCAGAINRTVIGNRRVL